MNFSHKPEVDNEDAEAVRETLKADRAGRVCDHGQ